jgi:hypothetical protein
VHLIVGQALQIRGIRKRTGIVDSRRTPPKFVAADGRAASEKKERTGIADSRPGKKKRQALTEKTGIAT